MSQSSETTKPVNDLVYLGYEHQQIGNNYYTARVAEGLGVCIAYFTGRVMIQFYPWNEDQDGHTNYAGWISARVRSVTANGIAGDNNQYPYVDFPRGEEADILMIKCAVEETIKQRRQHVENDQGIPADATAGEALE